MKAKNIMFSGFVASILTAVACSADAAVVASKEYVDARETAIEEAADTKYLSKTDAENTYVTTEELNKEGGIAKTVAGNVQAISDMDAAYKQADADLSDRITTNAEAIALLDGSGEDGKPGLVETVAQHTTDIAVLQNLTGENGQIAQNIAQVLTDAQTYTNEKIEGLDGNDSGEGNHITGVSQKDGKVTVTKGTISYNTLSDVPVIDEVLSDTSTNAVQNKAVKAALDDKQDTLTADSYIDATALADDKIKVVADGQIVAENTGLVTGQTVYAYALPKPENCKNTTCVLSVDGSGNPYWMQLWMSGTDGNTKSE